MEYVIYDKYICSRQPTLSKLSANDTFQFHLKSTLLMSVVVRNNQTNSHIRAHLIQICQKLIYLLVLFFFFFSLFNQTF